VNTVSHFTYGKGDVMDLLFDKAQREYQKRAEKLGSIKKWNEYNTLKVLLMLLL
jgi:tRNA(His) 5'-end guanylyltransferase